MKTAPRIPALFVSHGSPMVALQEVHGEDADAYARSLAEFGARSLADARAIVVMSAHWLAAGPIQITATARNRIVHDFGGFPEALYRLNYDCPGSPELSEAIQGRLRAAGLEATLAPGRPLDHGTWVPLRFVRPAADLPVIQISIPMQYEPRQLLKVGSVLAGLREEGVLLVGSGGVVHNLGKIQWHERKGSPAGWAWAFNDWVKENLKAARIEPLLNFEAEGPQADNAHPTTEHFLPIFFTMGASLPGDRAEILHDEIQYGTLSMLVFELTGLTATAGDPTRPTH